MSNDLHVTLCHDHFERLVAGTQCHTCPSRVENEAAVRALAAMAGRTEEEKLLAIVNEIHSIRRAQQDGLARLQRIQDRVDGNGRPGHGERLTIIETRLSSAEKNKAASLAIITAIASGVLAVIGMLIRH